MDRQEIKILFNYLENNRKQLNSLQQEFLATSIKVYYATGVLTKKQIECLYDLKEYIPSMLMKDPLSDETDKYRAQYSSFDHFSPYV